MSIHRSTHTTSQRVEIITSVERRRRWSAEEKDHLVAAWLEPGASVSAVAREAGIHASQLYSWRRQLRGRVRMGFASVRIAAEAAAGGLASLGTIEIELASGARMRVMGAADTATLSAAIAASAGRRRRYPSLHRGSGCG
ncbi:MAG: transposase [Parvibaculaceae bacterium]